MTGLSETGKEELVPQERQEEGRSDRRFFAGFLAGCLAMVFCLALVFAGWIILQRTGLLKSTEEKGADILTDAGTLYKLGEVQYLIKQEYLEEVDSSMLSACLFKGIAAGLEDPYANYYSAEELQSVKDSNRGEYFGIGATVGVSDSGQELVIQDVYENSPAQAGGLQAGDILQSLDGESVEGMSLSEVVSLIKSRQERFETRIYRPGTGETLTLTLECGSVELDYVVSRMLDDRVGYIQITEFTERAVTQFREAAESLLNQGMEQLIVDLRDNPGGLLDSVCDILDEIVADARLVYTEDRNEEQVEYYADSQHLLDCPVAVLVNGASASASEIFAGAVQDLEIGPVVGSQTYGKGVVQKTYTLSDGSAFKLTVEKYCTSGGRDINGNGITPDYIVEDKDITYAEENAKEDSSASGADPVLEKALEILSGWE